MAACMWLRHVRLAALPHLHGGGKAGVPAQIWGRCVASANSPLALVRHGVQQYLDLGVPVSKLVLGLPWYVSRHVRAALCLMLMLSDVARLHANQGEAACLRPAMTLALCPSQRLPCCQIEVTYCETLELSALTYACASH